MNRRLIQHPIHLFSTIVFALGAAPIASLHAQTGDGATFTTLYSFSGPDGGNPAAALVKSNDGDYYGTTFCCGANNGGSVFKLTPEGSLTSLDVPFLDGFSPYGANGLAAPLVLGTDGNLYTTVASGGHSNAVPQGYGAIFHITPDGVAVQDYVFSGPDGAGPFAGLVQGSDGAFYGTTAEGGAAEYGTVYRITFSTGSTSLTTLYSFSGADGAYPYASLVQGSDGNFYGTTAYGGALTDGTVFKLAADGSFTTLYSFSGTDGALPEAGLVQGGDGNLYGTTANGGTFDDGTVFKITPAGVLTTLYSFSGTDGAHPYAGLVQGSNGNFYGTTKYGGVSSLGSVFEITPLGVLTSLHSFATAEGWYPVASLLPSGDGGLYGTSYRGGVDDAGTVFKLANVITTTAPPVFTPVGGTYSTALKVTISDATPGASVYYTTDGSTPTTASMLYTRPVPILFSKTFQAIAVAPNDAPSSISSASYIISRRRQ